MSGDGGKQDAPARINTPLEQANQAVIKASVKAYRPERDRGIMKGQAGTHTAIEFLENDVDRNGVCVQSVNSRRIEQIELESSNVAIPPALQAVGQEPPDIPKEMWSGYPRHSMPNDTVGRASGIANHVGKIFDALGVEMNLGIRLFRKARKLLREATFRPVPAIHKGRNYGEAQIRASRRCRAVPRQ